MSCSTALLSRSTSARQSCGAWPTGTSAWVATRYCSSKSRAGDDVDFRYRIFNADGGEVEQCGNGARCFVQFVRDRGLTVKRVIRVETKGGIIEPRLEDDGQVTVDMGIPRFAAEEIPFAGGTSALVQALELDSDSVAVSVVSMGNPHAVQVVDSVDDARS